MTIYYIYKIYSPSSKLLYVGKTTRNLSQRLCEHKYSYKKYQLGNKKRFCCVSRVLENEDYRIELLEQIECDKFKAANKEGEWIVKLDCVNKRIEGRTPKEYREHNEDKIKETKRKYRKKNKDSIRIQKIEYRNENKDKIKVQKKKYRERNKEELKRKYKVYMQTEEAKAKARERCRKHRAKKKPLQKIPKASFRKVKLSDIQ